MYQAHNTKSMLAQTLKKLMAEKPLNKITIQEIVDVCGLQRQTFYYHFRDIYAALEWMYHDETLALLADYQEIDTWQDSTLRILYYVKDNAAVCLNAFNSLGHKQLRNFFYQDFLHIYQKILEEMIGSEIQDQEFITFVANLFVYGAQGYLLHWLESGMKETPEQIIAWFTILFDSNLGTLVRNYQANRNELAKHGFSSLRTP